MPRPIVAIVGAPNVGKSTLFNRLLGRRQAIVADEPGVTRDRLTAEAEIGARSVTLVDTGGVTSGEGDDLARRVREESLKAAEMADVILFVIDGRAGVTAADEHVARHLRRSAKRVIPVANKIDSRSQEGFEFELYRLGFQEVLPLSAEEGRGLIELTERIEALLPAEAHEPEPPGVAMAIVGRPNVGKSSLFNRLLHDERSVVSDKPGTTRDPVDATFTSGGTLYRVVDTAGIRRRITGADNLEWVSVLKARQALERASVAVGLVDAVVGIEHQDRALLGLILETRKPAVLGVNKIDLVAGGEAGRRKRVEELREGLRFSPHVPIVPLSAKTGAGVDALLTTLERLREESARRFTTPELNRALESILQERHPPSDNGRAVSLHYITQAPGSPPRFVVFGNGRRIAPEYRRFMEHRLRDRLGLAHAPITLLFRRRAR
jgi:GTP-binding protein